MVRLGVGFERQEFEAVLYEAPALEDQTIGDILGGNPDGAALLDDVLIPGARQDTWRLSASGRMSPFDPQRPMAPVWVVELVWELVDVDNTLYRQDRDILRLSLIRKRGELSFPLHLYYREKGAFSNAPIGNALGVLIGVNYEFGFGGW